MKNKKSLKKLEFELFQYRVRKLLQKKPFRDDPFSHLRAKFVAPVNGSNSDEPSYSRS
jgi:hypothetical protein